MLRRARYTKIIDAQLDLFVHDNEYVLDDVADRLEAYNRAERNQAEELYGDYVDSVETGTEILADMRDHYAATLEQPDAYLREFNRAVARRLAPFALEIENR
jgi:hypothetical protein